MYKYLTEHISTSNLQQGSPQSAARALFIRRSEMRKWQQTNSEVEEDFLQCLIAHMPPGKVCMPACICMYINLFRYLCKYVFLFY